MSDLLFESATHVAARLHRREISSFELTQLLLARIDAVDPALNAIVGLRREQAMREAAAADDALTRGAAVGPLHGVPVTVKEAFHVQGMPTTWGNPAFAGRLADWDATVVARLRAAGAIIVGLTNVHFMLSDFAQTANEVYGTTNNPWDVTRAPGGSSGGSAAALSAGLSFLEYGTDLVGSIRIPAACCGVYGLKPSARLVPSTGMQPPGPRPDPSEMGYISSVGPLARSPADLRTALQVTAGPEGPAGRAYTWTLPPSRHTRLADFRVGVVLDHPMAPVSSEVGAALASTVDVLAAAGAKIVEGWPDGIDPAADAETFGFHVGLFLAFHGQAGELGPISAFVTHENHRMAARAAWSRYFVDVDVFLCPTNFTPAIPHDTRPFEERVVATPEGERPYHSQAFWVSVPSLPGLPALSAPVGVTAAGLPVGAQLIGPLYEDDTVITFASLLGDLIGGYRRPPL